MNAVKVSGYVVRDSEAKSLESGVVLSKIRLAIKSAYKDKNGDWKRGETVFTNVKHFNGEPLSFRKGEKIEVVGRLSQFNNNLEIIAYTVKPV